MTNIKVFEMTINDLNSIKATLSNDFDNFWNVLTLQSELNNPRSYYLIAKQNEEILGFAGILDTVDQFEITNIVVRKDKRNKGIGSLLLKSLLAMAKSKGKHTIFLEVNEKNVPAINLYEKNGFKKCGLRKKYYNNKDNAILMKINL